MSTDDNPVNVPGAGRVRSTDVRLIAGAVGISALGDILLWVPMTLHLRELTGSGIAVAALMLCLWGPSVVLAPAAGLLVDRMEARRLLVIASLAQAVVAGALVITLDSLAAILVLATLLGIGIAVARPAEFVLVPVVAGDDDLVRVNGYIETSRYAGMTAGPLLGGALVTAGSVEVAILVNALTFVLVALAALCLRSRRHPERSGEGEERSERARDGIVVLARDRRLALVLAVGFVSLMFMSACIPAEVFFVKEDLHAGDAVYAALFSLWTLGMVIGALVVARRVSRGLVAVAVLIAVAVQGAGLGLATAWLSILFIGGLWVVGGLGHGTKNVLTRAMIQESVPAALHGRAFAAYNGLRNGAELFALAGGGLLIAAVGARETIALAGAAPFLAAVLGLAAYSRLGLTRPAARAVPETQPSGAAS